MEHAVRHAHVSECKAGLPVANGIIFVPQFAIHVTHARKCKAVLAMGNGIIFAIDSARLSLRDVGNRSRYERYCGGLARRYG
jgi:hypothetical protein